MPYRICVGFTHHVPEFANRKRRLRGDGPLCLPVQTRFDSRPALRSRGQPEHGKRWTFAALLRVLALGVAVVATSAAFAAVRCPVIFGDHMVLQRDRPVVLWGEGSAGEQVTVEFAGRHVTATTSAEGRWEARLPSMPACPEPGTLVIRGENTVTFHDVVVGEVWFCSGQSNMEKQIGPRQGHPQATDNFEEEIRTANHPLLRLFQVPHHATPDPAILGLTWVRCSPESVEKTEFSAVAYFFGRELERAIDVPIGLIHSSFGASQIEAWLPETAFEDDPAIRRLRQVAYPAWDQGMQATELYETMVKPFVPYTVRGFLWYQGEANCIQGDDGIYTEKMRALVASWRTAWGDPAAPWYYVQIAPYRYSAITSYGKRLTPEELPLFWEAQTRALEIPNTGMVVTTDLAGDRRNIHPTNKRDVGVRLARLALAGTYGRGALVARSPRFAGMRRVGQRSVEVKFKDVGTGLMTRDGAAPNEFTIAGADRRFFPATAELHGDTVVLSSEAIADPVAVRFAWREVADPNLTNSAGLPAISFRTDDWPVLRERESPPKATP